MFARLLWLGGTRGYDFEVYDRAARAWWAGTTSYTVLPELQGFVFKYPPWVLPVWIPFGALPHGLSLWAWSLVQGGSLVYTVAWCVSSGVRLRVALSLSVLFFFLFLEHFVAGQVGLPVLALGLWGLSSAGHGSRAVWARIAAIFALSAKVFGAWSLVGLGRVWRQPALLARATVVGLVLFAIGGLPYWSHGLGPVQLLQDWMHSAGSGSDLGVRVIRGPQNHSLVNLLMRVGGVAYDHPWADTVTALLIGLAGVLSLLRITRGRGRVLPLGAQVSGWLAVGLLAQPLGWVHSYVLAFPLCAWNVELALRERSVDRRRILWVFAGLAVFGVALAIPQVIRSENVVPFDRVAAKAWGVIAGLVGLAVAARRT